MGIFPLTTELTLPNKFYPASLNGVANPRLMAAVRTLMDKQEKREQNDFVRQNGRHNKF